MEMEKLVLKMVILWSQEEEPEHKTGNKEGSIKGVLQGRRESVSSGKEFGVQCSREKKGKKHEE